MPSFLKKFVFFRSTFLGRHWEPCQVHIFWSVGRGGGRQDPVPSLWLKFLSAMPPFPIPRRFRVVASVATKSLITPGAIREGRVHLRSFEYY